MTARDVAIADLETLKLYEHGYTGSTPCYANVALHIAHLTEQVRQRTVEAAEANARAMGAELELKRLLPTAPKGTQ